MSNALNERRILIRKTRKANPATGVEDRILMEASSDSSYIKYWVPDDGRDIHPATSRRLKTVKLPIKLTVQTKDGARVTMAFDNVSDYFTFLLEQKEYKVLRLLTDEEIEA